MAEGVCPKCGWKAPAGLLKCPFCKTYIRKPGSASSSEEKADKKLERSDDSSAVGIPIPPLDPNLPPPDPTVVKKVKRELARELFDDSDKWQAFEPEGPAPDEKTDTGKI